jgi:hypothetical protein
MPELHHKWAVVENDPTEIGMVVESSLRNGWELVHRDEDSDPASPYRGKVQLSFRRRETAIVQ